MKLKHVLIGKPFPTSRATHERLDKVRGLAVFASDPISSNAYATEVIMSVLVLVLVSVAALQWTVPIALVIALPVGLVNDGGNLRMFAELGIRAMSPTAAALLVLDNLLRRPSTLRLMTDLDSGKDVREVTLKNSALAGHALKDIRLDGDVLVAMIRRDKQLFVPHGNTALALSDQLTLLGAAEDVAAESELFERQNVGLRLRDVPFTSGPRSEETG
jgi:NhaP-type Na+/H+ and K+/H+ antiporter